MYVYVNYFHLKLVCIMATLCTFISTYTYIHVSGCIYAYIKVYICVYLCFYLC